MSDSRKFKIGGVEKTLKELWQEKKSAVASLVTNDGKWNDISSTLATASDDDYKNYKFKINKKGEMEPILNETTDVSVDDIVFSSSKSNLRRIADLERNISILANRIATTDGKTIDTESIDTEDVREWDNYITEDTFFTKDVNLGNYSDDKIKVYGHLSINNGVTFGTNARNAIKDTVSAMISNNTESGIVVTYDATTRTLDFNVSDPVITLTGDVTGSATMTNLGAVSISTTVANDSHTHAFANITGKPTTLAGYGITDSLASGTHTHTFASLTSKPTTLAGYGITDGATDAEVAAAISTALANITGGASAAFDTLRDIQTAVTSNDADIATILSTQANKADKTITISAGPGLTGGGNLTAGRTISHADTSSAANLAASGRRYVTGLTFDDFGHVVGYSTGTETVVNTDTNTTYTASKGVTLLGTDFRLTGNEIPGSVDLNTYRATGYYAQNANADAASGANYPTANAGILQVINDDYGNGLHTTQLYSQYSSTNYYIRTYYNGTWTAWRNLALDIDTNIYVTGASFNTGNGVLTLSRNSGSVTVDLDGRFTDNAYADTMNQHVRTTDSPSFANVTATNFNGTATYAKYADLAERYAADAPYEEGTLLAFGGEAEVTAAQGYASTKIAGVVSVKPAVAMNAEAGNSQTHPFVALQGRVPVKVVGTVRKGDILVASDISGVATVWKSEDTDPRMTAYVGIAIENKIEGGVGFVEVKVGK